MMEPGKCWHMILKKNQQCGLDARRYLVIRPNLYSKTKNEQITKGPYVYMYLCQLHVFSVRKQGYDVTLDDPR
jgi:hypothetical protein